MLLPGPGYEISHSFCQLHSGTVTLHLADPGDVADAVNDVAGADLAAGTDGAGETQFPGQQVSEFEDRRLHPRSHVVGM